MIDTDLEDDIRRVLASQADLLVTPQVDPGVVKAERQQPAVGDSHSHGRWILAAVAAVLLAGLVGAATTIQNLGDTIEATAPSDAEQPTAPGSTGSSVSTPSNPSSTGAVFQFETPQVYLHAEDVAVDVAGETFAPSRAVEVDGDPGGQDYTTLELTWFEHDVEMRIYLYFTSDGTDWWATEIRTYNGAENEDWITTEGEFFRSPLGQRFVGNLTLDNLSLQGIELEAFTPSDACIDPQGPIAIVADEFTITGAYGPGNGYATSLTVLDTASCQPTNGSGLSVEVTSANPDIAAIQGEAPDLDRVNEGKIRVELNFYGIGETSIHVEAHDKQTGSLINTIEIPVSVHQSADEIFAEAETTD